MKKSKKFIFFVNGEQTAWVHVWPSEVDRFELIIKRVCRYAAKFGYNLQYEMRDWEGEAFQEQIIGTKKKFKIVTRFLHPTSSDFDYLDFANYDEAFSYCFDKARKEECDKVELYECTDPSIHNARLCPISEFYHW